MKKAAGLAMVLLLSSYGCAAEQSGPPEETGNGSFTVVTQSPTEIDVIYENAGTLRARAVETAPGLVEVSFEFADSKILYKLDYNRGIGDFLPSGQPLDASTTRLIEGLFGQLEQHTAMADHTTRTRAEEALYRQANLMTIVPVGESLHSYTFVRETASGTKISCSCYNQYIGSGYYRTAGKGCGCTGGSGNGCKGRCGQGCGGTSTPPCWGNTSYTQDCAKHDYGLGSWWAASDDYTWGHNNCSCSGTNCY